MRNAPWLLLLLLAAATATAQQGDPLRSPACLRALDALQAEETAARANVPDPARAQGDGTATVAARIQARRKFAAGTCLGAWMDAPPPASRAGQPPVQVSPVTGYIPRPPVAAVAAPSGTAPARQAQQPSIVSCDVGGCTTSDGARLPRAGGLLLGPRGPCTAQVPGQTCP